MAPLKADILVKARTQRIFAGLAALTAAALVWLPCMHFCFFQVRFQFLSEGRAFP